jgi:REP-associated tyrosine transposase
VFFSSGDQVAYLELLRRHAVPLSIEVVAYCLMPNHVHLVLVPERMGDLHRALKAVHGQYAQRVNRMRNQNGHFWQGRYFSSPLDSNYFINAVRYVELNPVRAGIVTRAEEFPWSSASAHCGLVGDLLVPFRPRSALLTGIADWSNWLRKGVSDQSLETIRRNGSQNLPCGSDAFVETLEKAARRTLRYRRAGRECEQKGDGHI